MPKRILVAEDEPNIAKSLSFLLTRAGFQVQIEADGARVVDLVRSTSPDALLLDLMLPGAHGYDILRDLRADPATANLPVMILTAKGQQADRQMAIEAGATEYVTKPFSNAELVAKVKTVLDNIHEEAG